MSFYSYVCLYTLDALASTRYADSPVLSKRDARTSLPTPDSCRAALDLCSDYIKLQGWLRGLSRSADCGWAPSAIASFCISVILYNFSPRIALKRSPVQILKSNTARNTRNHYDSVMQSDILALLARVCDLCHSHYEIRDYAHTLERDRQLRLVSHALKQRRHCRINATIFFST